MTELAMAAAPRPTLGELAGHDRAAGQQIEILTGVYQRRGIGGLRDTVKGVFDLSSPDAKVAVLVEAVLTLSERSANAARQAADAFDRAEAADEREKERQR
jgi:hypothetical protein